MRMKHAPWSDSRWPSKCSSGIPAHFLANPPEYRTFLAVGPFAIHDRALAQRIYKTEDTMAKTHKWTASTFVSMVHENLTEKGHKVKKSDLSWAVKDAFQAAISAGARGMRVRFPEIGAMASRDVKARKAGKGVNPFTGESIMLKARPASKKPRWSFPKAVREAYIRTAARKAA
ncbi:MAG: hypothetical protein E6I16_00680 [Chloroflexi bacterium]|nr:MAG: hypothetical protein E6I16_00680 [Chloroflexota bacterium]